MTTSENKYRIPRYQGGYASKPTPFFKQKFFLSFEAFHFSPFFFIKLFKYFILFLSSPPLFAKKIFLRIESYMEFHRNYNIFALFLKRQPPSLDKKSSKKAPGLESVEYGMI